MAGLWSVHIGHRHVRRGFSGQGGTRELAFVRAYIALCRGGGVPDEPEVLLGAFDRAAALMGHGGRQVTWHDPRGLTVKVCRPQ